MAYPTLAQNSALDISAPIDLLAGSRELHTNRAVVATGVTVLQYQIISLNAAGEVILFDPAGSAPANLAIGIACVPATAGQGLPYYTGGDFNHAKLVWPAATTTLALRKAVFARSGIAVSTILK